MNEFLHNNKIISERDVYKTFPNVSIPRPLTPDAIAHLGLTPILEAPKPQPSSPLMTVVRDGVTVDALGNTVQAYKEVNAFNDYTDEQGTFHSRAEQEQAHLAKLLQDAKDTKKAEMKTKRDELVNGIVPITTTLGNTFQVDAKINNRSNMHQSITNAVNAGLTDADTVVWKMGDNSFQTVTYGEIKEIGIQLAVYINTQFAHEATKLAEIEAATLGTVESITW